MVRTVICNRFVKLKLTELLTTFTIKVIMSRLLAEIKMSSQNHRDLIQAIDELGAAIDDDGGSSLHESVMIWLDLNRDG